MNSNYLKKAGLQVVRVPGDGNCQYHSISHQLHIKGIRKNITMDKVKDEIINYIKSNPNQTLNINSNNQPTSSNNAFTIKDFIKIQYSINNIQNYIKLILTNSSLKGDELSLMVASKIYQVPIKLYQAPRNGIDIKPKTFGNKFNKNQTLELYYHLGAHYESTCKKNDNKSICEYPPQKEWLNSAKSRSQLSNSAQFHLKSNAKGPVERPGGSLPPNNNSFSNLKNLNNHTIKILYVRHCNACHNKAQKVFRNAYKGMKKGNFSKVNLTGKPKKNLQRGLNLMKQTGLQQAFCTSKGAKQSYLFGKFIRKIIRKIGKFKKIKFYSSVLPRAFLTSCLIANGVKESQRKNSLLNLKNHTTITRMNNFSEMQNSYGNKFGAIGDGTSNVIRKGVSDKFAILVNKLLQKLNVSIESKIIGYSGNNNNYIFQTPGDKIGVQNEYKNFMKLVIDNFDKGNTLNVVVGHGKYLRTIFEFPDKKLSNLDSIYVEYNIDKSGNVTPRKPRIFELNKILLHKDTFEYDKNSFTEKEDNKPEVFYNQFIPSNRLSYRKTLLQNKFNHLTDCKNYSYEKDVLG